MLRSHGRGIVFCRTRRIADRVAHQLSRTGLETTVIHGSRSQPQRQRAIDSFGRGDVQVLVATDVAARGIHIDDVGVVVHWNPVDDPKDYVHRSGRTARAGASGTVVSLVEPGDAAKIRALRIALDLPGHCPGEELTTVTAKRQRSTPPSRRGRRRPTR